MRTVKDILTEKGSKVFTVNRQQKSEEALEALVAHGIGAVVVVDDTKQVVGIFSERDFVRLTAEKKQAALAQPIHEIMTTQVLTVHPEQTVDECMSLVTERRCRHLPVVVDGELRGLVSIGDLVKSALAEKEFLIRQLKHYISS